MTAPAVSLKAFFDKLSLSSRRSPILDFVSRKGWAYHEAGDQLHGLIEFGLIAGAVNNAPLFRPVLDNLDPWGQVVSMLASSNGKLPIRGENLTEVYFISSARKQHRQTLFLPQICGLIISFSNVTVTLQYTKN